MKMQNSRKMSFWKLCTRVSIKKASTLGYTHISISAHLTGTGAKLVLTTWETGMEQSANQTRSSDKMHPEQKRQTLSQAIKLIAARCKDSLQVNDLPCTPAFMEHCREHWFCCHHPHRGWIWSLSLCRLPCLLSSKCWLSPSYKFSTVNQDKTQSCPTTLWSSLCSMKPTSKMGSAEKDIPLF